MNLSVFLVLSWNLLTKFRLIFRDSKYIVAKLRSVVKKDDSKHAKNRDVYPVDMKKST